MVDAAIGSGRARISFQEINNLKDSISSSRRVIVTTLSSALEYKIWPILGLSVGGGYKWLPSRGTPTEKNISSALNSFFYALKIKVHLNVAYQMIKKKL